MKKSLLSFVVGLISLFLCLSAEAAMKVIRPPTSFTNNVIVRENEVLYCTDSSGAYIEFLAGHDQRLRSIRLVMNDKTVYKWNCQYSGGKLDVLSNYENGVHADNTVSINRAEWVRFFEKKVALAPFEFQPTVRGFSVNKYPIEFAGYIRPGLVAFKVKVSVGLLVLEDRKFILNYPRIGEFFLGMKDGRYLPLTKSETGEWLVPLLEKPVVTEEFPLTSTD